MVDLMAHNVALLSRSQRATTIGVVYGYRNVAYEAGGVHARRVSSVRPGRGDTMGFLVGKRPY